MTQPTEADFNTTLNLHSIDYRRMAALRLWKYVCEFMFSGKSV